MRGAQDLAEDALGLVACPGLWIYKNITGQLSQAGKTPFTCENEKVGAVC